MLKLVFLVIYIGWDMYIDELISLSADSTDKACIIGLDSGMKWTTDQHPNALKLTKNEAETITKPFRREDFTQFRREGVCAEGVCYAFLRADENMVTAWKKGYGALTLGASRTAIVIAHTAKGKSRGNTYSAVKAFVEYLAGMGI